MTAIALVATTQTVVALDILGRHDEAHEVFREDTGRDGAMALVDSQRARLTIALIGAGRLDEAQSWLDQLPPRFLTVEKDGFPIAPLVRLRLLCAQRRHAEARALAEGERDRVVIHMRSTYDRVQMLDHLREACEALGDRPAAAEAASAAREACLPLVNLSARARYLATQIEHDPPTPRHSPRWTSGAWPRSRPKCRPNRARPRRRRCPAFWPMWCTSCATRSAA